MQYDANNAALGNLSALIDFSKLINSNLELNFILNNLLLTCFGKFHTTKGLIALADEKGVLKVRVNKGFKENVINSFPQIDAEQLNESKKFDEFLRENQIPLFRIIISNEKFLGVLLLGKRMMGKDYEYDDLNFLETIVNIGATSIENSIIVDELKSLNRNLDAKVNQLASLFDLSKEFGGILEIHTVVKLLVFSIIGQMMVSRFAVITTDGETKNILETKFPKAELEKILASLSLESITTPLEEEQLEKEYCELTGLGVSLIIPMQLQGVTKGLILLGKRISKRPYARSDIEYIYSVGSLAIISIENSRLFKEELEKQKLEKDLELARNIQKNLLPNKIPQIGQFEIAAFNNSARQVGGDYYDVVKLDEQNLLFALGDVSGKGVQAALLMANLQAFLKSLCKQKIEINSATDMINDLVAENTIMGSFITFFWGILNRETDELHYVNAGHNPPLLLRNGEIIKLKTGGMILGVMETMIPYLSEVVKLERGDMIICFTDGITEAMNIRGEEFSDEKLEEMVKQYYSMGAAEILDKILEEVKLFTSGAEQSDDITMLVVKVKE